MDLGGGVGGWGHNGWRRISTGRGLFVFMLLTVFIYICCNGRGNIPLSNVVVDEMDEVSP